MNKRPLEIELELVRLQHFLQQYPEQATELALNYFEDFLVLSRKYRQLEAQFQVKFSQTSVSLPPFLGKD
jgi:Ethanolamine utilization protein EutJ (predicted chaperonin)